MPLSGQIEMQKSLLAYYRTQQSSQQWVDFLSALAAELSSQASDDELRQIFAAVGKRQALALEGHVQDVDGLAELASVLNEYWAAQHWGFVNFSEKKNSVEIVHAASPLADAFGEDALAWSVGYLEGFYEQIFKLLGAGRGMHVSALDAEESGLSLIFELASA
jgi:hypothetical protein